MIENSRSNDPRYPSKYGMNMDYAGMSGGGRQGYEDDEYVNPDDEPLETYLAVEDADMVTGDRSFGIGNDYQYGKREKIMFYL